MHGYTSGHRCTLRNEKLRAPCKAHVKLWSSDRGGRVVKSPTSQTMAYKLSADGKGCGAGKCTAESKLTNLPTDGSLKVGAPMCLVRRTTMLILACKASSGSSITSQSHFVSHLVMSGKDTPRAWRCPTPTGYTADKRTLSVAQVELTTTSSKEHCCTVAWM